MGVTSCATLPFLPGTHVFSTVFKLLQANSTLFKHLWLVTSLVFPTEIEHYSCFRLYSGLRKISPGTPFPEGKHRKRGILNLQLFIFCQISGICYFQLLQGMRLLTAVAQHPNISSALPFPGRRRGGRNGGFPSGKRSEIPGNIAQRPRSPHLKQPSGQQENRGSNKPRQTAKPQRDI